MNVNELINQLQVENQRLQAILIQKQTLTIQNNEIENALKYLENYGDDVYKSIGPILVKSTKNDVKKELTDNSEEIKLKLDSLEKQEKRIKEKVKDMQENIQNAASVKGQGG